MQTDTATQAAVEFFTPEEVVELFRIKSKWPRMALANLRKAGLPAVYVLGRYLYPKAGTLKFIQCRRGTYRRQRSAGAA
jgi:hypothetical protein